jgi:hypothetical protein
MIDKNMQDAHGFLNEARNSLSLVEVEVLELQKKADDLAPKAEEYDRLIEKLDAKKAELAAAEKKHSEVASAHAKFAKLVNG